MNQQTKQLTKKQFYKRKTQVIAGAIIQALTGDTPTKESLSNFPRVTHYKAQETGEIRVGLSLRGIRKLVKKYPLITTEQVMEYFNVSPMATQDTSDV